eukprot:2768754-Alexandrium_andersonii.AAC.1
MAEVLHAWRSGMSSASVCLIFCMSLLSHTLRDSLLHASACACLPSVVSLLRRSCSLTAGELASAPP